MNSRPIEQIEADLRMVGMDPEEIKEQVKLAARSRPKQLVVEVAPGITVPEHLISAAVAATSNYAEIDANNRMQSSRVKEAEDIKHDIDASRQAIQEMVNIKRIGAQLDPNEKYVSYDAMSPELQRVVKAYVATNEAQLELKEAITALQAVQKA